MATKAQTVADGGRRQSVVVEFKNDNGPEWWVMYETGDVEVFDTASAALKGIRKAARKGNQTMTITTIQWRNVPAAWRPPQE